MNVLERAASLVMADHAVGTDDLQSMLRDGRKHVKTLNDFAVNEMAKVLGQAQPVAKPGQPETPEDDMGVRIGDEVNVIHPQPPSQTSLWAKAAAGAAIGFATAGPLGAAFAIPSILEAMRPTPPAQVAPAVPAVVPAPAPQAQPIVPHVPVATPVRPDTETIFEMRLGDPKPPTKVTP